MLPGEPLAADQIEMFFTDANRANGKQAEIDAFRQVYLAQKGPLRIPVFLRGHPVVFIAEARRPLGGGNQRAVVGGNIKKIELLRLGDAVRIVVILRSIGLRAAEFYGHAEGGFSVGNSLHAVRDFFSALGVFAAELRHKCIGSLAIKKFECAPRVGGHAPGHQRHGSDHRQREQREKFGAKTHGIVPPAAGAGASQTSSSRQPPQRGAIQSRTCGPRP